MKRSQQPHDWTYAMREGAPRRARVSDARVVRSALLEGDLSQIDPRESIPHP